MFNLVAESLLVACFFLLVSYKRYFEISPPLRIALLSASSHKIIQESWNLCQMILLITRGSYNCSLFRVDIFRFWNLFRRHHALVHHFLVFPSILYDFCMCFSSNQRTRRQGSPTPPPPLFLRILALKNTLVLPVFRVFL